MDFDEGPLLVRNFVGEIAELVAETFKNSRKDAKGNILRFVNVKDVEYDYENLDEVHQLTAVISYSSDIGQWDENIIIRYFDSEYQYLLEKTQYDKLIIRTLNFPHINPVDLLFYDFKRQVVVYSMPKGKSLDHYLMVKELRYYQYGMLMAVIHGGDMERLELVKYNELSKYLMNHIGFSDAEIMRINAGLNTEFDLLSESFSGYEPVSIFEPSLFFFTPKVDDITKISKSMILQGGVFDVKILPSIMKDLQMDRMEDISTLFAIDAYKEYLLTERIDDTLVNIMNLMEGYEGVYEKNSVAPMDTIYPNGLSLDIHMVLSLWLYQLNQIHFGHEVNTKKLAKYSRKVLSENWFQIYGKSV